MGKKQKKVTEQKQYVSTKKAKLPDSNSMNMESLLNNDVINKLKSVAQSMKEQQAEIDQQKVEAEAALRKAEQKRLENDFAYLLEHSDPKANKYK